MSSAFWAADSLATQMTANANAARAATALHRQQGYHCGDIGIQRAALAELRRLDPGNPLLFPAVSERIYDLAERVCWRHGWARGASFEADPHQIHSQLLTEFEASRDEAIKKAVAEPIKARKRGWIFINRRTVFSWQGVEYPAEQAAIAAKRAELNRLQAARLGDQLAPA